MLGFVEGEVLEGNRCEKTTKEYCNLIIEPYMEKHGGVHEHAVIILDCWTVHRSREFLDWMKKRYPKWHILFLPANCTGKFQPADLILQRVVKHIIRQQFAQFLCDLTLTHLQKTHNNASHPPFKIDTKIGFLRDLVPAYLTNAYEWMIQHPDVVTRSWERAQVQCLNLLSAWTKDVQDEAVQMHLSRELFPNNDQSADLESEWVHAEIGDSEEVSVEKLVEYACSGSTDLAIAIALQFD